MRLTLLPANAVVTPGKRHPLLDGSPHLSDHSMGEPTQRHTTEMFPLAAAGGAPPSSSASPGPASPPSHPRRSATDVPSSPSPKPPNRSLPSSLPLGRTLHDATQGLDKGGGVPDPVAISPFDDACLLGKRLEELTFADVRGAQDALLSLDLSEAMLSSPFNTCDEESPVALRELLESGEARSCLEMTEGTPFADIGLTADYAMIYAFAGMQAVEKASLAWKGEDPASARRAGYAAAGPAPPSSGSQTSPWRAQATSSSRRALFTSSPTSTVSAQPSDMDLAGWRRSTDVSRIPATSMIPPSLSPASPRQEETRTRQSHTGRATWASKNVSTISAFDQHAHCPYLSSLECLDIVRKVAEGHSSSVYMARDRHSARVVGLKSTDKAALQRDGRLSRLRDALRLHHFSAQRCRHVLPLYACFDTSDSVHVVMEYADGGTLTTPKWDGASPTRRTTSCLSEEDARRVLRQVTAALCFLHANGVAHGEVTGSNILLVRNQTTGDVDAKLTGFSHAVCLDSLESSNAAIDGASPRTPGAVDACLADMEALGTVAHRVLCGCPPPEDATTVTRYPETLSAEAIEFLQVLVPSKGRGRLTARAALAHPFLSEHARALTRVPRSAGDGASLGTSVRGSARSTSLAVSTSSCSSVLDVASLTGPSFSRLVRSPCLSASHAGLKEPLPSPDSQMCSDGQGRNMSNRSSPVNTVLSNARLSPESTLGSTGAVVDHVACSERQPFPTSPIVHVLSQFLPQDDAGPADTTTHPSSYGPRAIQDATVQSRVPLDYGDVSLSSLTPTETQPSLSRLMGVSQTAVFASVTEAVAPTMAERKTSTSSAKEGKLCDDTTSLNISRLTDESDHYDSNQVGPNVGGIDAYYAQALQRRMEEAKRAAEEENRQAATPPSSTGDAANDDEDSPLPQAPPLQVTGEQTGVAEQGYEDGHSGAAVPSLSASTLSAQQTGVSRSECAAVDARPCKSQREDGTSLSRNTMARSGSAERSRSTHGVSRSTQRSISSTSSAVGGAPEGRGEDGLAPEATDGVHVVRDRPRACAQRLCFDDEESVETEEEDDEAEEAINAAQGLGDRVVWNTGPKGLSVSSDVGMGHGSAGVTELYEVPRAAIVATRRRQPTAGTATVGQDSRGPVQAHVQPERLQW